MSFDQLGLSPELCRVITTLEYNQPTPVQVQAIPIILKGRDLLAGAQTGTGKTAAFALPMLELLLLPENRKAVVPRKPRALVLAPTRELAAQVHDALRVYGRHAGLRSAAIFGGVGMQPQVDALRRGVDVVVATPGRLLDHMERRTLDLSGVEFLILDEADRMLDMGFLPDLRRILKAVPRKRQTVLLSATLPVEIKELAAQFMNNPAEVQVAASNAVAATVSHLMHPVAAERKRELLEHLLTGDGRQTLVFCRTKHGSDRLCRHLRSAGFSAAAIHGDKAQSARTRALEDFKSGRTTVLVATDVAARGLDIEQLPVVINFDLPTVAGDYIHRIGRTGRAGIPGHAISLVCGTEQGLLQDIQRLIACKIQIAPVSGFETAVSPASVTVRTPRPSSRNPRTRHPRRPETRQPQPGHQRSSGTGRAPKRHREEGSWTSHGWYA